MTSEKAIELLKLAFKDPYLAPKGDFGEAIRLGIEALERIQELRGFRTLIGAASSVPGRLLPSEEAK